MKAFRQAFRDQTFGFLLIPGLVALAFVVLAVALVTIDSAVRVEIAYAGDASGAREVLSSIGGSLITVAGLAFSITIVTLQLVSSQFSPRALRSFLGDRANQVIAGIFVGTFAYCLLVLGTVRDAVNGEPGFVPGLSVSTAVLLAMVALAVLLFFIHHMSQGIQVSKITSRIAREALDAIDELHPRDAVDPGDAPDRILSAQRAAGPPATIYPQRPGYVETVALDDLIAAYRRRSGPPRAQQRVVHVTVKPGDFVTEATPLIELWPAGDEREMGRRLRRAVRVVDARDIEQDVAYAVRQLVDIALRAISPAVNDPTTAITCMGYVRAIMERLAERPLVPEVCRSDDPRVVVITSQRDFQDLATEAFAEIGRYGASDPRLIGEVLGALAATADSAARGKVPERARFLAELASVIATPATEQAHTAADRNYVGERLAAVRLHLPEAASERRAG